jgi:hypothetical protein
MQQKTFSKGFAKTGGSTTTATSSKAAPVATAKKEYQHKPDHVGYLKQSKAGNQVLVVEQDITLEKGSMIILRAPSDEAESLARNGIISEEQAQERIAKIPEWKLAVAKVLPKRDT